MDGGSGSLDRKGLTAGTAAMGLLLIGIVLGSGTLRHYDPNMNIAASVRPFKGLANTR